MLPKKYRLQKNRDFKKVFKKSKKIIADNFSIFVSKNGFNTNRFGFVISNKVEKRATRRNAIKRQLRSIFYDLISELNTGYDVVVVVKKPLIIMYKKEDIKNQILDSVKKTDLMKNDS